MLISADVVSVMTRAFLIPVSSITNTSMKKVLLELSCEEALG